ncbi:hypothetical protein GOP47_0020207 [Adiantum capillus-veneris]|uniref:PROP1-like PPR domain-containing protein n=1 Tax=Adiantum capillus-veneris TaxID=13818 RepID=A0A9D4Z9C1_ADICA|nr:hypothetical protein GOP47_0020207 [Adiantum capillus-veneris]
MEDVGIRSSWFASVGPCTLAPAAGPAPSASSSCSCFSKVVGNKENEQQEDQSAAMGWTAEQFDIVTALLRTPPKPFPVHRAPPPPRLLPKHRPVGLPARRLHLPNLTPRPAKDKLFLTDLAVQISKLPPHSHASQVLHGIQHLLVCGSLSATVRHLGHLGLPLRAFETLEWQQTCSHLWPDERALCAAIDVLAEEGKEEIAWDLLHTHAPMSSLAFEALARGLIAASLLNRALLVKEKAESSGLVLNQGVYAELILLASRLYKFKEMRKLVQELGYFSELQLGLEHCTSIMAACRKAQMYDAVLGLFEWWKQADFVPNVVMYQIVMTTLSDLGKYRDALAVYWEMTKNGCPPHLSAYDALFEICAQLGDASRALKLLAKMRESNISPTHNIYINLIKVCCQDGRLGKAREFIETMRKEGLPVEDLDKYAIMKSKSSCKAIVKEVGD